MIKVVDNFLSDDEFFKIQEIICSNNFPFYYNDHITDEDDPIDYYYFIHLFFINNEPNSNYFNLWMDGFQPERHYRIEIKVVSGSGANETSMIYDDDFTFKVVR